MPSWDKHLEETSLQLHVQNLRSHVGIGLQKCLWPHRLRMRPPNTPVRLVMAVRGQRWFSLQSPVQGPKNKQIIMANEETTRHLLDCQYTLSISPDEPQSCYPSSLRLQGPQLRKQILKVITFKGLDWICSAIQYPTTWRIQLLTLDNDPTPYFGQRFSERGR